MDLVGSVAAVATGFVFVVAGASKLARGAQWPAQARAMGAPSAVALLVPWWELGIGAASIVGLLMPWPAWAAAGTLAVFTALIVVQLGRGRHPQCACFGAWSAAPLSVRHVWRNAGFLAVAIVAAVWGW